MTFDLATFNNLELWKKKKKKKIKNQRIKPARSEHFKKISRCAKITLRVFYE